MFDSRSLIFVGSLLLSAALLILFATGFFNKSGPQMVSRVTAPTTMRMAQEDDGGDQGDTNEGTEVQQSEQDQQNQDNGPNQP